VIDTNDIAMSPIIPGRAIIINIPWDSDKKLNILVIYAPNSPRDNKDFWNEICTKIEANPTTRPDVMLGDFNMVEDPLDRLPSKSLDPRSTEALRNLRLRYNLSDGWRYANPDTKGYTWLRESDGTQSRLDRIYVREDFLPDCKGWEITHPPIPTDHDIMSAEIATPTTLEMGRGRWAVPPRVFKNKLIKEEIQKLGIELEYKISSPYTRTSRDNPQVWLRNFKTKVVSLAKTHEKKYQPMVKTKIANLQKKLNEVRNNPSLPTEEIKIASTQIKKEIQCLTKETHQYKRNATAAIDAAEGEVIGKTWSNRAKVSKPRDTIKSLRDPDLNLPTRNSKRMAQIAA
jgi:hypothetical protein